MSDRVNMLHNYSDDQHFFHSILSKAFQRAIASKDPQKAIAREIGILKRRFPNGLRFIVWNDKGKTIEHLTDEKGYKYIVKNLYHMFKEVAEECRENYPGNPENLEIVKDKLNFFRRYLGRFLVPQHLRQPYQQGQRGRCILADSNDRFPLFWFHSDPELTLFCSISGKIIGLNHGLREAVTKLNKNDKFTTGIVKNNKIFPKAGPELHRELLIELGKFENASLPQRETPKRLFLFKLITPGIRGYSMISKTALNLKNPGQKSFEGLLKFITALALGTFVLYCYSLRIKTFKLSLRLKLVLLFMYANGLPLMILGSIGYEYLQQQRNQLIKEVHSKNEKLLLEIDSGFERHTRRLDLKVAKMLNNLRDKFSNKIPDKSDLPELQSFFSRLEADELYVFNQEGQTIISQQRSRNTGDQTVMKLFAVASLIFANQKTQETFEELLKKRKPSLVSATGQQILNRSSNLLQTLLAKLDSVNYFNFGTSAKLCYATLIGFKDSPIFHSLMIIVWKEEQSQSEYVCQMVDQLKHNKNPTRVGANLVFDGVLYFPGLNETHKLIPISQKSLLLQLATEENIKIDDKNYLVTAIAGKNVHKTGLLAITPISTIEKELKYLKISMAIAIMITLLVTASLAFSLSNQFLLPVKELSETVHQISQRNFRYRSSINTNDEFGDLGKLFNTSIKELEDLEIGRVVQENLFPGYSLDRPGISIYGQSVTMTRLGGDYYDFFPIDNELTGIFMGDVAGHGIPAALIMAMGKAAVMMSQKDRSDPSRFLASLHNMLYRLKSKTFKRMMTCQYLTINNNTGQALIANAGHCFPVLVTENGNKAEFLEIVGTPVGIAKRARYKNIELQLNQNDTLVLYSDGMLESANEEGEAFGTEGFLNLCKDAWNTDIKDYYQQMFNANKSWAPKAEDDLTIVIVRFTGDKKCL
jgi:HAMP domain-containing protein